MLDQLLIAVILHEFDPNQHYLHLDLLHYLVQSRVLRGVSAIYTLALKLDTGHSLCQIA